MKPMLMMDADELPIGKDWIFETKYDGFRALLRWNQEGIQLFSRNENLLNDLFPEIIDECRRIEHLVKPFLPLTLDGELVCLQNDFQSEFSIVQRRGRMRKKDVIHHQSESFPCQYIVFDLLSLKGEDVSRLTLEKRKIQLKKCFNQMELPTYVQYRHKSLIQLIETFNDEE